MFSTSKVLKSCNSWSDFHKALSSLEKHEKGIAFEDLVFLSLQILPRDTTTYKRVWKIRKTKKASERIPLEVRKKIKLPKDDLGIDLLAETIDGDYHAIQCKYHSKAEEAVTLNEVTQGASLAFVKCKGISHLILATTRGSQGKRSRHLKGYAVDKLSIRDITDWERLNKHFFVSARAVLARKKPPKLVAFKPRTHQSRAVKNAIKHFVDDKNSRGKMIMPCGSGKSLTAFWIAQQLGAKKIIVAVPSLALVKQTLEVWAEQSQANGIPVSWICVCSDQSVGQSEDEDTVQLQDLGVKVETDTANISSWLRKKTKKVRVVFTTYQSSKTISAAAKMARYAFDFGVFDEAHKTAGNKDKTFAHLLFEENIRVKRRIFMTATERRYIKLSDRIVSMSNNEIYGNAFEVLTFKEALNCEPRILSDYKIVTMVIEESELRSKFRRNIIVKPDKGSWSKGDEIRALGAALALRKVQKKYKCKHFISFHNSVARAKAFFHTQENISKNYKEYGKLEVFHTSSLQNIHARQQTIRDFAAAPKSLITNARCLTEGVDIKEVDCVLFADPKKSVVDIVQASGRALRPCADKKFSYIVIPIILSSKDLKKRIEETEGFKDIMIVLRALAGNDERIIEYFRAISEGRKSGKQNPIIKLELPLTLNFESFDKKLKLKIWDKLAKLSYRTYEKARDYVRKLKLKTWAEYNEFIKSGKMPADIPANPYTQYLNHGWINIYDYLGTPDLSNKATYQEAKEIVRDNNVTSHTEYQNLRKNNKEYFALLPSIPSDTYRDDWVSFPVFLGYKRKSKDESFWPYKKTITYLRNCDYVFKNTDHWKEFCKAKDDNGQPIKPAKIPTNPDKYYKEFKNWAEFLGYEGVTHGKLPFEKARKFARALKLKNTAEWGIYSNWKKHKTSHLKHLPRRPNNIPAHPDRGYKNDGWVDMYDWLGIEPTSQSKSRNIVLSIDEVKAFIAEKKIKSKTQWEAFCRGDLPHLGTRPKNIPHSLPVYFNRRGHDVGWSDFFTK